MMIMSCLLAISIRAITSSFSCTVPKGLIGSQTIITLVLGVIYSFTSSGFRRYPFLELRGILTGTPLAIKIADSKWKYPGSVIITSSPGFINV